MTPPRPTRACREVAQVLLNIRKFFEKEKASRRRISVNRVVERICKASGLSRSIVCQAASENDLQKFPPAFSGFRARSRPREIAPSAAARIRLAVIAIRKELKEEPTLDSILRHLRESPEESAVEMKLSRSSLHRLMTDLRYSFSDRPSHYDQAREDPRIIEMRKSYLKEMQKHRSEGRDIFYQDETWIFKNMLKKKAWFREDLAAYIPAPSGKGQRSIISHVGSKKVGLLPDALLLYRGANSLKDSDYHSEMNSEVFLDWLSKKVLPKIAEVSNSATLVLDRASYHTMLADFTKPPTTNMNKADLIRCIEKWDGPSDDWPLLWRKKMTNAAMLEEAKRIKPPARYLCQDLADQYGIAIIFLPVAHPELNPVELLWAQVKSKCAKGNQEMKLAKLEKAAEQHFASFTPDDWEKLESHVIEIENKYVAE